MTDGLEGADVKIWLAMINGGANPKTHALDEDGWLLCRGKGDRDHLETWTGYPFDVDCQKCTRQLHLELTPEEFDG